jgi:hypothetical protein
VAIVVNLDAVVVNVDWGDLLGLDEDMRDVDDIGEGDEDGGMVYKIF